VPETTNHKVTAAAVRLLILLLVSGFMFSYSCVNISGTSLLNNGQEDLANVIQSLQSFSRVNSEKDASKRMRTLIIAFQSASGLLLARQASGEKESEVIAVFYKLPFLFPSTHAAAGSTTSCIALGDTVWVNSYISILLTPPVPPPLLFS